MFLATHLAVESELGVFTATTSEFPPRYTDSERYVRQCVFINRVEVKSCVSHGDGDYDEVSFSSDLEKLTSSMCCPAQP